MARLDVNFTVDRAGPALREFAQLVGHAELMKAVDRVHTAVARRKVTSSTLYNRYAIPVGLRSAYQYMRSTGRSPSPLRDRETHAACTFAMAAVSIAALLSDSGKTRLSGMLRDSLNLQGDARRLQHEFSAAAHFSQHGWDITFLDLEGLGSFDYIFRRGAEALDVECKTISVDKGNAIHMLDAMNFLEVVGPPLVKGLGDALWTVDITFDVGLPKDPRDQTALAQSLLAHVRDGIGPFAFTGGSATIQREPMPVFREVRELHDLAMRRELQLQERRNGHACTFYDKRQLVAVGLSSARPSKVVGATYQEVKKACEQVSGERAGFVWTHFVDISNDEMRELGVSASPTGLDAISTRIFRDDGRRHVAVLGYSGEPVVRERVQTLHNTRVSSYMQQGLLKTHFNRRARFPIDEANFPAIREAAV